MPPNRSQPAAFANSSISSLSLSRARMGMTGAAARRSVRPDGKASPLGCTLCRQDASDRAIAGLVQLALWDRRFELLDLGGLPLLVVERQHIAFRGDFDAIAVCYVPVQIHLGELVLPPAR